MAMGAVVLNGPRLQTKECLRPNGDRWQGFPVNSPIVWTHQPIMDAVLVILGEREKGTGLRWSEASLPFSVEGFGYD
jgi:hypothetical protein